MIKKEDGNNKDIEIGALIENFDGKLIFIAEKVVSLSGDVISIKQTQEKHTEQLGRIEMRLDKIHIQKADKEEIKRLDRRVMVLESRV